MKNVEDRHAKHSTIIVRQLSVGDWYDVLEKNATIASRYCFKVFKSFFGERFGDMKKFL